MQKHFNTRAAERLGIQTNRHTARSYVKYLAKYTGNGIYANAGRYWFYVSFLGSWAWVLFDKYAKRLVTVITEPPRYQQEELIARAKAWGEGEKRPWA